MFYLKEFLNKHKTPIDKNNINVFLNEMVDSMIKDIEKEGKCNND